ncbi:tetratricopeptide repeat protein [Bacteroidales bacterium OttesenSCG-928-B11]|nr:tetratricopeptide repeat protein [Bacteroidales bacterium OttesenSCG-928-C03]MDL2311641.1 tetratricopeptide repeat protein [Bacteroidales bacterium OttesenSCG-928-B11]MDL2326513.1 tetratricopeptide repeat protein [Bacteroidales bacterium OttesenSCG-928-A14]
MKLFGLFKNKGNDTFRITEIDRRWVEDNFRWLIQVFGYPSRENEQILLSESYFPKTLKGDRILIENIIADLCSLFQIREEKIFFEVVTDIRDSYGTPYEIEGVPFETEVEKEEEGYKIYIANNLHSHPQRLIYNLVYEFIRIKLYEDKLQFDTGNDTDLFLYLAGIYFGFGVLLSQNSDDMGRSDDGFWETKWSYISEMPDHIMAFALATYSKLVEQDSPKWKDDLPDNLKKQFEKAIKYLTDNPSELYDKKELEANELFETAHAQFVENEFEEAIVNLQKILLLTNDDVMKSDVYNNLGYYNIRLGNYEKSIYYFKEAIQIIPDYGYANDNLGYALIQLGKLEEGKKWIDKALETGNNDIAYTYRNLALYFEAQGDMGKSEDYFKKSFDSATDSVDLLEYHYATFLMKNGEAEKGLEFLKKAVEKGELEAIKKMDEI